MKLIAFNREVIYKDMKNKNTKTNVNENKWESLIKSINVFSDDYLEDGRNLPKDIDYRDIHRE